MPKIPALMMLGQYVRLRMQRAGEYRSSQFDSPSGPPVRATVKWYNPDKGFGFVELAEGSGDAFLHVSVVERSGHGSVPPGATLEVRAGPAPKGPQVTEILSVDASTATQEQPRRPRPERPTYHPSADRTTVEEIGTVEWYNANKGFGFITPDRGGKDSRVCPCYRGNVTSPVSVPYVGERRYKLTARPSTK